MNFETMDWGAETRRIKRAFGVKGQECEFAYSFGVRVFSLKNHRIGSGADPLPLLPNGWRLIAHYYCERVEYGVSGGFPISGRITLQKGISPQVILLSEPRNLVVAKGLFHLDLLTPEVEAALKVTISSHQKLEWTLEFDQQKTA